MSGSPPAERPRASIVGAVGLTGLAVGFGLLSGCDRLSDAREEPSKTAAAEAQAQAEAVRKKAEVEADAKKQAEDAQKQVALADAKAQAEAQAKKKAEQDAKKQAEQDAKLKAEQEAKSRPVNLSDIAVNRTGSVFGGSGMIELTAKATLNQTLGSSTYVHVKSLCKKDDSLVADTGYLNAHYTRPLEKFTEGETAEIKGSLYTQGVKTSLSPCQFEFRVGGIGGGLSVPVGNACWNGSDVGEGACEPELSPVAMSGHGQPIGIHELVVERSSSFGGSKGLNLNYMLDINIAQDNSVRLTFKSACRINGKSFVDLGQANLSAGPFKYEAGETVARSTNLYWSSAFELADAPNDCDITTSLWKTKTGTFGEYEEVRIDDSCFKDDKLRSGRCSPGGPAPAAPVALDAESLAVDDVRIELSEPHGAPGKFQLKLQADLTVLKPVMQNDGATAKVSCKAGKDNRIESAYLFGPELYYLGAGETARMTANAFSSHALEVKPRTCKVEFFGGPRFSPSGSDGVALGTFCLKKDKVKAGGKC